MKSHEISDKQIAEVGNTAEISNGQIDEKINQTKA